MTDTLYRPNIKEVFGTNPLRFNEYVSHKRVRAGIITAVNPHSLTVMGHSECVEVPIVAAMTVRYTPVPGDMLVIYADGYSSISPRKAFEDGYTLAP